MKNNNVFRDAGVQFNVTGPAMTKSEIIALIPEPFNGKDDFVSFYAQYNGGYFKRFALIYRDLFQNVPAGQVNSLGIVGFFSILPDSEKKIKGCLSMIEEKLGLLQVYAGHVAIRRFIESHIPFAYDGSGNNHWIEIPTGRVRFIDMEVVEKGFLEIAPSFGHFVNNLVGDWREEDKL
jgi:hypothetical protein